MHIIEIIIIALGLAMDAFAVSVSSGMRRALSTKRDAVRLSFHFGIFQAGMPLIGWFAGITVQQYISAFDHWIAFILLAMIGMKMILDGVRGSEEENNNKQNPSKGFNLVMLSFATSIDALAVGFSLALINVQIFYPAAIIGIVTMTLSLIGIYLGRKIGAKLGNTVDFIGGIILIGIGIKILLSHIL